MTNLIKAECYKLTRNKTFWVLIVTMAGLSLLLHLLVILDWWQLSGTVFDQAGLSEWNALTAFHLSLFFNIVISTLAGFYLATEFTQSGVIKNQIMSGHKRSHIFLAKYVIYSLGSVLVAILIPFVTALIFVWLLGHGEILNDTNNLYLARAYSLFVLQFLSFTAIVLWIAVATEDSGKTILFTLLLAIVMFAIEKLVTVPFVQAVYELTFFYQLSEVFQYQLTSTEVIKSVLVGMVSLLLLLGCGVFVFNRKEIK
ncbi:ABC transporter permease [Gracilibacillus timonensis]|uniref:ABC transporter permease n=1 Tax=Gracilibacillus timonensis TaxID=1816696 RepID=UPI0008250994|nr:ABC transporter permease [Gracilibacillus timonensis]